MYLLLKKLSFSTAGCLGFLCPPLLVYQNAKSLNTFALGFGYLACFVPFHAIIPALGLRSTTRAKYKIEVGVKKIQLLLTD